jgi:hypothetical protein
MTRVEQLRSEQTPNIAFCPELPHPRTSIVKIIDRLGFAVAAALDRRTVCAFKWRDATVSSLTENQVAHFASVPIYNAACTDISKVKVSECHVDVFGRSLIVDPMNYCGPMVCKSNRNAAHDGVVVQGPLSAAEEGRTYSHLVNNIDRDEAIDYRVPVFRDAIPLVYVKRRPLVDRFANKNSSVELHTPSSLFSATEMAQITKFALRIGMDFGELDVLRDATTGELSVVDANNTPYGPPNALSAPDAVEATECLTVAFESAFLPKASG